MDFPSSCLLQGCFGCFQCLVVVFVLQEVGCLTQARQNRRILHGILAALEGALEAARAVPLRRQSQVGVGVPELLLREGHVLLRCLNVLRFSTLAFLQPCFVELQHQASNLEVLEVLHALGVLESLFQLRFRAFQRLPCCRVVVADDPESTQVVQNLWGCRVSSIRIFFQELGQLFVDLHDRLCVARFLCNGLVVGLRLQNLAEEIFRHRFHEQFRGCDSLRGALLFELR
mmetsp:Transcript_13809/g.30099  ORF Transcript_13809/g.30099 Transcript_13809/m.30099 type:complete len:230 (-) Transcript_13809:1111-1800(-)